jgi:Polyketide cyclase / dehydrase and lipid transport
VRVRVAGVLPVGIETAWAHLVRWERQAAWMADADEVRVVGAQREGVGVRIAVRTRVLNVPAFTDVLEVVRWEPPRLVQIAHLRFVRGAGEWRLDPIDADHTRFAWTEDVRLPIPVLGELALRVYAVVMRRLMRRAIDGLTREFGPAR